MHSTLETIKAELTQVAALLKTAVPNNEPFSIAHGNWSFPGVTRDELVRAAVQLLDLISASGGENTAPNDATLLDYVRRLSFLRTHTIPQIWSNAAGAVPAYQITISGLKDALSEAFATDPALTAEDAADSAKKLKEIQSTLRSLEARLKTLDPRSSSLDEKILVIERAHDAANQLPTDLATLAESRADIQNLLIDSKKDRVEIDRLNATIAKIHLTIVKSGDEAEAILGRCDEAYRASTSEGLASAFSARSKQLNTSMWIWVCGLLAALLLGASYGSSQLQELIKVIKSPGQQLQDSEIYIKVLLALLSVAAPVWFAWISTKQIGQRFRLAEDYGYKASISKAYEGYRREAALLEPEFQARLFSSALNRLDELPLRLVENESHGSPWHELASSSVVREALSSVPEFAEKVRTLAETLVKRRPGNKVAAPSDAAGSR
jgi:hypothetical protein